MKKILFIDFWNCSPHLETSLEIAKLHLEAGDIVDFYFCGHDTEYKDGIVVNANEVGIFRQLPEVRGIKLIKEKKLKFNARVKLKEVEIKIPSYFNSLEELKAYKYKNFNAGVGVLSSLVSDTKNSKPDLLTYQKKIKQMIQSCVSVYEFSINIINKLKPDQIYIFNGRFCNHRAVMCAAEDLKVNVLFHERGANKYLYDIYSFPPHNPMALQEEIKKNWKNKGNDNREREFAESFFIDRRAGKEQEWVSYTAAQKQNLIPEIDISKKIITYFSSSEDETVSIGDLYKFKYWENQLAAVEDLIEICQDDDNIQLIVRLHPHKKDKSQEDQKRWLKLKAVKNITLISFDSSVDTYALMECSDIVVTAGSTVGIEATYWKKPSICLGPSYYSELNVTYEPKSKEELKNLIYNKIKPKPIDGALAYGLYMLTHGIEYKYYKPETLFGGKFMGVNLQEISRKRKLIIKYKNKMRKAIGLLNIKKTN